MTNAKFFGDILARIRKERGYPSAHQFFKSVGGSKTLSLAFVSYWDLERGKKLPKEQNLKSILAALGLEEHSPETRELARAYSKALSGSEDLLRLVSAPEAAAADLPSRELAEAAAQKALEQISVHITLDQWKVCARDLTTYVCQYFLFNSAGWVPLKELAAATGFRPEAVKKAVKALAAGGLAELSGDKVKSPFAERMVEQLARTPATARTKAALRALLNKWVKTSDLVDSKRVTVRMTQESLDAYRRHLDKAIDLAGIYCSSAEDRRASAVYLVDTSVFRIFPKK